MPPSVKNRSLSASITAVLAVGSAHGLAPSASINYTFYAAGGSAQENATFWALGQLLQPGTIDVYTTSSTGAADGSYLILSGTTNAAGTTAFGASTAQNILFFYRFSGGAFPNGILPQANPAGSNECSADISERHLGAKRDTNRRRILARYDTSDANL